MATVTQWVRVNKNTKKELRLGMVFEIRIAKNVVGHAEVKSTRAVEGDLYLRAVINTKNFKTTKCLDIKQDKAVFSNNFFFGFAIYERDEVEAVPFVQSQRVAVNLPANKSLGVSTPQPLQRRALVSKSLSQPRMGDRYIAEPYRSALSNSTYSFLCSYDGQVEVTHQETGQTWSESISKFSDLQYLDKYYLYRVEEVVSLGPTTVVEEGDDLPERWLVWSPSATMPPTTLFVSRKQAKKVACIMSERIGGVFYFAKIEGKVSQSS